MAKILDNRWVALSAGLFVQLVAGTAYAFGIYSNELKVSMNWSQRDVDRASSLGNIGMYFGVFAGLFYDRFGKPITGLIGTFITSTGYLLIYLLTTGVIPPNPYLGAFLFMYTWHGSAWLDVSAIATATKNFPEDKGLALGIMKSFFGLSAAVIAVYNLAFFYENKSGNKNKASESCIPSSSNHNHTVNVSNILNKNHDNNNNNNNNNSNNNNNKGVPLMLFLSIYMCIIGAIATMFLRTSTNRQPLKNIKNGARRITIGYFSIIILALYLGFTSLYVPKDAQVNRSMVAIGATILLLPLLFLSYNSFSQTSGHEILDSSSNDDNTINNNNNNIKSTKFSSLVTNDDEDDNDDIHENFSHNNHTTSSNRNEFTLIEAMQTIEFYMILIAQFTATGAGLMVINNIAQIDLALGGAPGSEGTFVLIIGVSNCFGRMLGGYLSESYKTTIYRPLCYAIAITIMTLAQLVLMFASKGFILYIGAILTGLAYGSFWSIGPALINELFGDKAFGSIYQTLNLAPALGSYMFSAVLAAKFYEENADSNNLCCGQVCYRTTHLITGCCTACGVIIMFCLHLKVKSYYVRKYE